MCTCKEKILKQLNLSLSPNQEIPSFSGLVSVTQAEKSDLCKWREPWGPANLTGTAGEMHTVSMNDLFLCCPSFDQLFWWAVGGVKVSKRTTESWRRGWEGCKENELKGQGSHKPIKKKFKWSTTVRSWKWSLKGLKDRERRKGSWTVQERSEGRWDQAKNWDVRGSCWESLIGPGPGYDQCLRKQISMDVWGQRSLRKWGWRTVKLGCLLGHATQMKTSHTRTSGVRVRPWACCLIHVHSYIHEGYFQGLRWVTRRDRLCVAQWQSPSKRVIFGGHHRSNMWKFWWERRKPPDEPPLILQLQGQVYVSWVLGCGGELGCSKLISLTET